MDQESLADFQALLRNDEALQKVIQDRATARNEPLTFFDVVAQANEIQNTLQPALLLKEMDRLPTVKLTAAPTVKATGDYRIYACIKLGTVCGCYQQFSRLFSTHIKRQLVYMWAWEYEPFGRLLIRWPSHGPSGLHPLTGYR